MCEDTINCDASPCFNGATCMDGAESFTCECVTGFGGKTCMERTGYEIIDVCKTRPCANDGECEGAGTEFTCTCKDGFTGTTCKTNVDECSSSGLANTRDATVSHCRSTV